MNKLRSKTFLLVWILINLFSLTLIFVFNYQVYKREENFGNNDVNYCQHCGGQIKNGAKYCSHCGTEIKR